MTLDSSSQVKAPQFLPEGQNKIPPAPPYEPTSALFGKKAPVVPLTVTEALQGLLDRQEDIKRALDVLIADATTLRAQM
jgi:hypothetical protein